MITLQHMLVLSGLLFTLSVAGAVAAFCQWIGGEPPAG